MPIEFVLEITEDFKTEPEPSDFVDGTIEGGKIRIDIRDSITFEKMKDEDKAFDVRIRHRGDMKYGKCNMKLKWKQNPTGHPNTTVARGEAPEEFSGGGKQKRKKSKQKRKKSKQKRR